MSEHVRTITGSPGGETPIAQPTPVPSTDAQLLREVLDRMNTIEAREQRTPTPFDFHNLGELEDWAKRAADTFMVPKNYRKRPNDILVAVQWGYELGLKPLQALNSIAVINGRPGVFGDAMPGICIASGKLESVREWTTGERNADDYTAHCEVKRRGNPTPFHGQFSIADAKTARLWSPEPKVTRFNDNGTTFQADNDSPWHRFPQMMLKWRSRVAYRDAFPDVLRGLLSVEELRDIAPEEPAAQIVRPTDALDRINQRYAEKPQHRAGAEELQNQSDGEVTTKTTTGPAPFVSLRLSDIDAQHMTRSGPLLRSAPDPGAGESEDPHTESKPADAPADDMGEDAAKPAVMTHDGKQKLRDWITELKLRVGVARKIEDIRSIDQDPDFVANIELVRQQKASLAKGIEDLIDSKGDWIATMMRENNHG